VVAAFLSLLFMGLMLRALALHLPHPTLGAANRITILRTALIANLALLAWYPPEGSGAWAMVVLMVAALALDGVDGWAARHYRVVSPFGARLDQELDALFTLVMALAIFRAGQAGAWILLAGLWHYAFYLLQRLSPAFLKALPFSQRRRVICAVTLAGLILSLSPLVVPPLSTIFAALTLILLSLSFVMDIVWLWRHRLSAP
jgi:phosphatidylglycerophosphate synthase